MRTGSSFCGRMGAALLLLAASALAAGQERPRAFIDGTGPGWRTLGEGDFAGVNGDPDT